MRDRHLWTEPKSLLCRVSPGRSSAAWGVAGGARSEGRRVWEESQGREGSLAFRSPSLSSKAGTRGRPWRPPLCPRRALARLPPPASSWDLEKWRLERRASGPSCAPRGAGPGPSPEAFTVPRRPRLVQEARASQPLAPGPAPRGTAPRRLERGGGASWGLGSHLGLKGPREGSARVVGGPGGAPRFPARSEGSRAAGAQPARLLSPFRPGTPHRWSRRSSGPGTARPAEWPRE